MSLGIKNGRVFHKGRLRDVELLIRRGKISEVAKSVDADRTIDAEGRTVLPGAIDAHVHFRDPGATHKEDWKSGSKSAAAGGVTTVVDQPNTSPPTVNGRGFDQKRELAEEKSIVDFGINGGVTRDWVPEELLSRPLTAFGEVFMADSTGEMGIPMDFFQGAVERIQRHDELVTVHAEDSSEFAGVKGESVDDWSLHRPPQAEVSAVKEAVRTAKKPLHFAHISHPNSLDTISGTEHTCEVTPHHLLLSRDDLDELGTFGKMNPPLRAEESRRKIWGMIDRIDIIASDHAPHTIEEKNTGIMDAPSGVPGVETMLPLLLAQVVKDSLSLKQVVGMASRKPADIFGLASKGTIEVGKDADIVITDMDTEKIKANKLHSKAGWTPFEGHEGVFPDVVLCRGEAVYDGRLSESGHGRLVSVS
ncbi:MAG: dihydroorotase [Halobacteria archaeon]|nr:dihydroorotase [Halobacteria archaeon]